MSTPTGLLILSLFGVLVIYSASGEDPAMLTRQVTRLSIAFGVLFIAAQVPPHWLKIITFWLFVVGLLMLIAVPIVGESHKGAQRWLNFGVVLIQPSEMMKLIIPNYTFRRIQFPLRILMPKKLFSVRVFIR